jgi:O-antigen ligase
MPAPHPSHPVSRNGRSAASRERQGAAGQVGIASSVVDWLVTFGLAATLAWTTLCLGGFRPETMVVTSNAVWALTAIGGVWLVVRPRPFKGALLLPVPFLLYALASTVWIAPAAWLAWREWLLWLQMWLVFGLTLSFVRRRAQTAVLLGTVALLGVVGAIMALYQRFGDPGWLMLGRTQADQFVGRSSGMFGIPNSLAAVFELLIPICLTLGAASSTSKPARIGCGTLGLLWLIGLVLTGSRGGWISLTLALAAWPLFGSGNWKRRLAGVAVVVLLAIVAVAALYRYSEPARGRIQPFLDGQFESSRPIIWKVGVKIWREHPWLGTGTASYNVLFDQHRPRGFLNEPQWTHNDYLNTLSDYGLAGFALWFGAGVCLVGLGWRSVARARATGSTAKHALRFGLWLGCLAFLLHMGVDFHTKMPALAFMFAIALGVLLRRSEAGGAEHPAGFATRALTAATVLGVLVLGVGRGGPLYRAEAVRYDWRQKIDRAAAGRARLEEVVVPARTAFASATRIDPQNARAWSDLAYAMTLAWHVERGNTIPVGRAAVPVADRALALCPVLAEFWVRKGVALDMQGQPKDAGPCFERALALAPNNPEWHFYYAYHLSTTPGRKQEALAAVGNCLALDPGNSQAIALRARLESSR